MSFSGHVAHSNPEPSSLYSPLRVSHESNSSGESIAHGIVPELDAPAYLNLSEQVTNDYSEGFELQQSPLLASADPRQYHGVYSLAIRLQQMPFVQRNTGLLLVAFSQLFFALMHTSVKILNSLDPPISALELVAVRMAVTYICCVAYMIWKRIPDPLIGPEGVRLLLVFRGFSGFLRVFGVYYSLQYLSLSDATVLTFLSPFSTALAGHFVLNEVFSRREAAAGALSLIGVILIAQPQLVFGGSISEKLFADTADEVTPAQRLLAVGVALLGVLGATGVYTSIRAIGKRAHPLHSLMYFSSHCVLASLLGMLIVRETPIFPFRFAWVALFLLVTIFGFLAQESVFLTMGLQRESAGRGTLAIYVQIIFASVLEQIFFHTIPSALSVAGTIIILGSAIFVALTKKSERSQPPVTETLGTEITHTPAGDSRDAMERGDSGSEGTRLLQDDDQRMSIEAGPGGRM
ncbi:hypothetical protein M0805_009620 [Coniferiporia weirii]|nr:hypothetical protein M0805_009620 [Coniferiporia weirii]